MKPVLAAVVVLLCFAALAGPAGAAGAAGPTGGIGTTGSVGATGPTGADGPTGWDGPTGSPGPTGAYGATGVYEASGAAGGCAASACDDVVPSYPWAFVLTAMRATRDSGSQAAGTPKVAAGENPVAASTASERIHSGGSSCLLIAALMALALPVALAIARRRVTVRNR
jgi:hypothetical protein